MTLGSLYPSCIWQSYGIYSIYVIISRWLVSLLVFYDTFSTNRLCHAIEVGNVSHRAGGEHKYHAIRQRKNTEKPTQS